jgi:DNA helicase-2/ATP-dependent DNA helicase PcrA
MRFNDPSRFLEEIPPENIDSIVPIKAKAEFGAPKVLSGLKPIRAAKPMPKVNVANFIPNDPSEIKEGMNVLHMKFGSGKVLSIDERNVATIHFSEVPDNAEKRIMLQYAKLQILN